MVTKRELVNRIEKLTRSALSSVTNYGHDFGLFERNYGESVL